MLGTRSCLGDVLRMYQRRSDLQTHANEIDSNHFPNVSAKCPTSVDRNSKGRSDSLLAPLVTISCCNGGKNGEWLSYDSYRARGSLSRADVVFEQLPLRRAF